MDPFLIGGLAWLLSETELLSHVTGRLLDRFFPRRGSSPLPQVETAVPATPAPGALDRPSVMVADRLMVPPPDRLLFVRESPGASRPVLAIVLSDGPSSGRVRWILGKFDVPIKLELPDNAIALLPLMMKLDGLGQVRLVLHDYQLSGMVDHHQVLAA